MERRLDTNTVRPPTRLSHVVLRVRSLERSVAWYEKVLVTEVIFRNEHLAFLGFDKEHHRIALVELPDPKEAPAGALGLDHVAFAYDTIGDLLQVYKRLREGSLEPDWSINHGTTTSFYYADPDGNQVELQVDNFLSEAEMKAFMSSPAFKRNPLGVEVDPAELTMRYERGDSLISLVHPRI
jgi:catechol-2,3-dioxygenase